MNYSEEIAKYKKDLASRIKLQEMAKTCNAIIRKAKGADCTMQLELAGLDHTNAVNIQQPDFCGRIGFPSYVTTNNLANIKRIEGRIKELEGKMQQAETTNDAEPIRFEGGEIVLDYSIDRLQIRHDSKPSRVVIDSLKHSGFHWSPTNGAWQRQITNTALWQAETITGIKIRTA